MADTNPPAECQATRPTNADQHPGLAVMRKRHTKAEIEYEKALLEEKKAEKIASKPKMLQNFEDWMAIDDAGAKGAHPQNQKGLLTCIIFCLTEVLIHNRF